MIALVDYGAGNLTSVKKALTALAFDYHVPTSPDECVGARGLIVPGVGNFATTSSLNSAWRNAITDTIAAGTPLLGICVGMQWLFESSAEAPGVRGLGTLQGQCTRLRGNTEQRLKVPHVGWNTLEFLPTTSDSRLLTGIEPGAYVYFTHSYAAPVTDACAAATTHGQTFAAAIEKNNIFGVQFHPEKSSEAGLQVLRNFLVICANEEAARTA